MNWTETAKDIFRAPRPVHFTNFEHCSECQEHDKTLLNNDVDSIGLTELGNPGWDPMCFCHDEGKKYYMPALIRLSLETAENDFYFEQLLFHLEGDGENNSLFASCTAEQRAFVASFLEFMIEVHGDHLEKFDCADSALRAYEIWSRQKVL